MARAYSALALCLSLAHLAAAVTAQLKSNFYSETCPGVEAFIEQMVQTAVTQAPPLAAKLLRLHFHDCFVQGCDGSILLDATDDEPAEKDAEINLTVGGYDFIDEVKAAVEERCPGTVSCADIVALAARDAVHFRGGPKTPFRLGRRDGFGSTDPDATALPTFVGGVRGLLKTFAAVGLNTIDMIALSGGHTLGVGSCLNVQERLPPFKPDGLLEEKFLQNMTKTCIRDGQLQEKQTINLDYKSPTTFDNQYYQNLRDKKGAFITDSLLRDDRRTAATVSTWARDKAAFFRQFMISFQKMSQIQVLTGGQGEVRFDCRATNQY